MGTTAGGAVDDGILAALRGTPLLEGIGEEAATALAAVAARRRFKRGEVLWESGQPGDHVLLVRAGELAVLGGDASVMGRLGAGACVGEVAALLGGARSATVVGVRPGWAVEVPSGAFREALRSSVDLIERMAMLLGERLLSSNLRAATPVGTTVVAVSADDGVPGAPMVAAALVALARHLGVTATSLVAGPSGLRARDLATADAFSAAVAERAGAVRLAVVELPDDPPPGVLACSDVAVRVTATARAAARPTARPRPGQLRTIEVHNLAVPGAARLPLGSSEPFVLPADQSVVRDGVDGLLRRPDDPLAVVLRRLVRSVLGVVVGAALGGGAAFGIANIGVLAAFEDAGVDVDLFSGTSMGSIIAIGAAGGMSGRTLGELAGRLGTVRTTLSVLDPTLSGAGLLSGRRLVQIFDPVVPGERFEDLVKPCRVVAMDVEAGEAVEIGDGPLRAAFRASCSIPLVFTPARRDGRTLVDGAMIDPVPAEVVRRMGADLVAAVNVVPRLEKGVTTVLSRAYKRASRLNPATWRPGRADLPDLLDVIMNSLQVVQHELGAYRSVGADVSVKVPMSGFTWIDFYRATELVARGYEAGRPHADAMAAMVKERLGA